MKQIFFITIALISELLFASSPKLQGIGAGKPEHNQNYFNFMHMAIAFGDIDTLINKLIEIKNTRITEDKIKEEEEKEKEEVEMQLRNEVMMAPFERGSLSLIHI